MPTQSQLPDHRLAEVRGQRELVDPRPASSSAGTMRSIRNVMITIAAIDLARERRC